MNKEQVQHLIEQIKKGDNSELGSIYTKFRRPFLRFASRFDLEQDELLDVYQDSIIAMVDNIRNGKIEVLNSSLKTYLFSIGKFMIYKRLKRLEKVELSAVDVNRLQIYTDYIEEDSEFDAKEIAIFRHCFKQLGKKCKEVLNMFYYRGFTLEEIQETLGYENYNVVKSQKSRCLRRLKSLVNNEKK